MRTNRIDDSIFFFLPKKSALEKNFLADWKKKNKILESNNNSNILEIKEQMDKRFDFYWRKEVIDSFFVLDNNELKSGMSSLDRDNLESIRALLKIYIDAFSIEEYDLFRRFTIGINSTLMLDCLKDSFICCFSLKYHMKDRLNKILNDMSSDERVFWYPFNDIVGGVRVERDIDEIDIFKLCIEVYVRIMQFVRNQVDMIFKLIKTSDYDEYLDYMQNGGFEKIVAYYDEKFLFLTEGWYGKIFGNIIEKFKEKRVVDGVERSELELLLLSNLKSKMNTVRNKKDLVLAAYFGNEIREHEGKFASGKPLGYASSYKKIRNSAREKREKIWKK